MQLIYLAAAGTDSIMISREHLLAWLGLASFWSLIIILAVLALTLVLRRPLALLIIRLIRRLRRSNQNLRDQWELKLIKPVSALILGVILMAVILNTFSLSTGGRFVRNLAASYFTYTIFRVIYASLDLWLEDLNFISAKRGHKLDITALSYITTTLKVLTIVVAILTILSHWINNLSAIIASVGIGGLIVALAAQDTAANLFASVAILLDKPFAVGHWISAEGIDGSVEKIGLRSTHIRMADRSLVAMPNAKLANATVTNMTERVNRLVSFSLGLDPQTKSTELRLLLERIRIILADTQGIEEEGQMVRFDQLDNRHPAISIRFLTINDYGVMLEIKETVNLAILALLEEYKIRLATTAVTVYTGGIESEATDLGTQGI